MARIKLNTNELIEFLKNSIEPDTLEYFYSKITNMDQESSFNQYNVFSSHVKCNIGREGNAFSLNYNEATKKNNAQVFFVIDLFEHQIFPKSRTLRILSRKVSTVMLPNPRAGQFKIIKYGAYEHKYPENELINANKYHFLYARNSWDRKNELIIKEENGQTQDQQEVPQN